jgi:signal peptidase I
MTSVAARSGHGHRDMQGSAAETALPAHVPAPSAAGEGAHHAAAFAARAAQSVLLAVAVLAFAGLAVLPLLSVYRTLTVLSGSMRPTFGTGDVIISRKEPMSSLRVGDIITYHIPIGDHHLETHRVVRLWRRGGRVTVETEGDANAHADPWRARLQGETVWREVMVIPKIGWAIVWLRDPIVRRLGLYGAPLLLVLIGLFAIWRRPEDDAGEAAAAAITEPTAVPPPAAPVETAVELEPVAAPADALEPQPAAPGAPLPEPPAQPVRPEPEPPIGAPTRRGQWSVRDLERLVGEQETGSGGRGEEWGFYVDAMREYADAEGWLPETLDWLVWETFGDLLTTHTTAAKEADVAAHV